MIEHVAEPQEPVRLLADRLVDGPRERPQEVLLAEVAALIVAEMREVRAAEVRVAERDEPGHYSTNPPPASGGTGGIGEGPATDFRYSS